MEAPTPLPPSESQPNGAVNPFENAKAEFSITLEYKGDKYILQTIKNSKDSLTFIVDKENNISPSYFTLEIYLIALKNLGKSFSICDSIDEIIDSIKFLKEKQDKDYCIKLVESENKGMAINFITTSTFGKKQVKENFILNLKEVRKNYEELNRYLINYIKNNKIQKNSGIDAKNFDKNIPIENSNKNSDIVPEALDDTILNGKRDKTGAYDKLIYVSMLAEQCKLFGDMVFSLKKYIKEKNGRLNSDERNLFSIACKNYFSKYRDAIRTLKAYENKEKKKEGSIYLSFILEYINLAIRKGEKAYSSIANFIKANLLPNANDSESKTFYLKMIADYNRNVAEFYDNNNNIYSKNAGIFYEEALNESKNLNFKNPIKLGLTLNYTVYLYEILKKENKAIQVAEECLKNGRNALKGEDEEDDEIKDCNAILDILKENIDMWKEEQK